MDCLRTRQAMVALLGALLSVGLSGCTHKKVQQVVLPQSQAPVALATPPPIENPPMVEAPPVKLPPTPTAAAASKPKRERRRPSAKPVTAAPAAPQVAVAEGMPEASAIGALTSGQDAGPQVRQEAADLIASNDKRLKALPADTVNVQRSQISKIRNFQRQAQEALDSGDAEGAKTLATKAKLLLYDLDRGGGN